MRPRGEPRLRCDLLATRSAANARAVARAAAADYVSRSMVLPRAAWTALRNARAADESSDAQTLARLILTFADCRAGPDELTARVNVAPRNYCDAAPDLVA